MKEPDVVWLGNNQIVDCQNVLVIDGVEVFRLRDRDETLNLVVDFDVLGPNNERIAKVAKNYVAYAAAGYGFQNRPGVAKVIQEATGDEVVKVVASSPRAIKIIGTFWVGNYKVEITEDRLVMGGVTLAGNVIQGFRKAIELRKGAMGIAVTGG